MGTTDPPLSILEIIFPPLTITEQELGKGMAVDAPRCWEDLLGNRNSAALKLLEVRTAKLPCIAENLNTYRYLEMPRQKSCIQRSVKRIRLSDLYEDNTKSLHTLNILYPNIYFQSYLNIDCIYYLGCKVEVSFAYIYILIIDYIKHCP